MVVRTGPITGPVPKQHIRARVGWRCRMVCFAEQVVTNSGHWIFLEDSPALMFDLKIVAKRVDDQVVLDQAGEKRVRAIRVAQIDAGPGAPDHITSQYPFPGRTLGRNANCLLIVSMALYDKILKHDMMRPVRIPLGLDTIHRQSLAIKYQVPNCHIT